MDGSKVKNGVLITVFALLFLPVFQSLFPFIESKALNGEFAIAPNVEFSIRSWLDSDYAAKKTAYLNDNMGLRSDLIRLNNQVDFSLFDKIHSEWRLMGDHHCVFQDVYIYSYLGRDYDGYDYIHSESLKLKAIQDTFTKLGKTFMFVHSPCKAFFYPEFLPDDFRELHRGPTNYESYKRMADSLGINQIDFNAWFVGIKPVSKEILYPRQGFHWSMYGALIAGDSMVRYIERQRRISMVHPVWTEIEHTQRPRNSDDDIQRSMNLIWPYITETLAYPNVSYRSATGVARPSIIFIGDSFLFQWMDDGVLNNSYTNWQIWYYNHVLISHDVPFGSWHPLDDAYRIDQMNKADCIVLMFTSRNMSKLSFGFIDFAYNHYFPGK
jgi:SGNH hydrolase-like domain, acetyltransferase AlgX